MQQLPALLLTAFCGFNLAQEFQKDAGEFDCFLMAIAECEMSSTKLSHVNCIIEQVLSPIKQ